MKNLPMLILFLITLIFVGCGHEEGIIFDITRLQAEDGSFQYGDIPFGSSEEDTIQMMDMEFEEMQVIDDSGASVRYSKDTFNLMGNKGRLWIGFKNQKLESVNIQFTISDKDSFSKIADELVNLYGEAEVIENEEVSSVIYKWQNGDTHLNAILSGMGEEATCVVGVFSTEEILIE